jgi:hypothetical protein
MPLNYFIEIGLESAPSSIVDTIRDALPPIISFVHFQCLANGTQEIFMTIEDTPDDDEMDNFAMHKRFCDHLTSAIHRVHPGVVRDMRVIVIPYLGWYISGYSDVNDQHCIVSE